MVVIKKLEEDRWAESRDLRLDALRKEPIAFGSSYEEEKRLSEGDWRERMKNALFAISEDRPIGMIALVREKKTKARHIANIYGMYVNEKYRGLGIGRKLMDSALKQIRRNKEVVKVKLTVNPKQKAAVKLYLNCGFKVVGRSKKELRVEGRFYDDLIMEKML